MTTDEKPIGRARVEPPDLSEKGGLKGGTPQRSDERLFMQLTAFGECRNTAAAVAYLAASGIAAVVYEDLNDPLGLAVLTMSTSPDHFLDAVRPVVTSGPFTSFVLKPQYSMF